MIDENKISILKTKINNLGNVLKKYEFNKAKLEDMFSKKMLQRNSFILHMLILLNHTPSMLMHIMLSCMVEFINVLIVAEMSSS